MSMIFKIAWRNVFRNRRRSIITFIAVAIGIICFLFMEAITVAIQDQSKNNLKRLDTAHLKIFGNGYWKDRMKDPLDINITDYRTLIKDIKLMPDVESVTQRTVFQTKVYDGKGEITCTGIGIDLGDSDSDVFDLKNYMVEGKYLEEGEYTIIGTDLADLFDARPGDYLTIEFKDKNGVYDAAMLQIKGLFNTGHPDIDKSVLYVPFEFISDRLAMNGAATELAIKINNERNVDKFKRKLETALKSEFGYNNPVEVLTWKEQAEEFLSFAQADYLGNFVVIIILGLIIIVGIANTMLMAVFERFREIGTLKALGMKGKDLRRLFLVEGGIIGCLGAVVGGVLGFLALIPLSTGGLNLSAMYGDMDIGYLVKDYVYTSIRIGPFLISIITGIIVAVIASYLPARRAAKLHAVEALRRF